MWGQVGSAQNSSDHDVYLLGNLEISLETRLPLLDQIVDQIESRSPEATIILLGNTLSNQGLPEEGTAAYLKLVEHMQGLLLPLVEASKVFFAIPGQNEWTNGNRRASLGSLDAADDFFEDVFKSDKIFRPQNGCGEPYDVAIGDDIQIVLYDSQWMLNGDEGAQRKRASCDVDDELDFSVALDGLLKDNRRRHVILAGHHPVWSAGEAGGFFPLKDHIFPLANLVPGLYLPLPIVGSVVPLSRKLLGGPQEMSHPNYASYRAAIENALTNFENTIVVSARDHSLQYFQKSGSHYIVSGSTNHANYLAKKQPEFGAQKVGFARLSVVSAQKDMNLTFYQGGDTNKLIELHACTIAPRPTKEEQVSPEIAQQDFPPRYEVIATDIYATSKAGESWLGSNYRAEWSAKVQAKTLLLDTIYGGLTPIKKGGGFQTKSLRLEDSEGHQYTMRSVGKFSEKLVPPALRNTFVQGLIQDGISASHPYGALAIPKLADAAGVYHTNPELVFVPAQAGLGIYNDEFGNQPYIFEERPQGDATDIASFGNSKKIFSTLDVIEKIEKDEDHVVDQDQVLRSRLFDIWLADWDRHEDQWRWASFKDGGKTLYRPIPRDRDQVFFKLNGIISWLIKRPYFKPNFQAFAGEINSIDGLNFNARHFDRTFLNQKSRADFIATAHSLQALLTDEIIEAALHDLPPEIYDLSGEEITSILKIRRQNLVQFANRFFDLINDEVTITGTNRNELFEINYLPEGETEIKVFDLTKQGEKKRSIYQRTISGDPTQQVLLYGLKGDDIFTIKGKNDHHPKLRIVGGSGDDRVDAQEVSGRRNIFLYDRIGGVEVSGGSAHIARRESDQRGINSYDRKGWKQNKLLHFPLLTFYTDEGIGIGHTALWTRQGFRKEPFKSNHRASASFSPRRSSIHLEYEGTFRHVFRKVDLKVSALFDGLQFIQYFYGLGNASAAEGEDRFFHIVNGHHGTIAPEFSIERSRDRIFGLGPVFEYFDIDPDPDRFPSQPESRLQSSDLISAIYAGWQANYRVRRLDKINSPARGLDFQVSWISKFGLRNTSLNSHNLSAHLKTYVPFNVNQTVVWASNLGYANNFGDFAFYHANYLANRQRLRGFELGKFGGSEMFYHANDLRIALSTREQTGQKISWGIHGSFDYGRVWYEPSEQLDEDSGMHTSVGGGLFLSPLDVAIIRISYFTAKDDAQINIGVNFSF